MRILMAFPGEKLKYPRNPKTISASKMQIHSLQDTNWRGDISVYFYARTADWRLPIPFYKVSFYSVEGANLHFGC